MEEKFNKIDTLLDGIESYIREIKADECIGARELSACVMLEGNLKNMKEAILNRDHFPLNFF